jgi:PiT family inorganic phosphate transporter
MLPPLAAVMRILNLRLFVQDVTVRWALLAAGAFGAYSLGANNIANVMGPFIHVIRPPSISLGFFFLNPTQVLFLIGALAIAVGVVTYGRRVMFTVGRDLFQLSPLTAWVAVVSHAIVLILFTSKSLATWLDAAGLPQIPLVPVSSSQAIVGAVIGIGLFRGASSIRWHLVGGIVLGWLITPICAGMLCLAALISVQMML